MNPNLKLWVCKNIPAVVACSTQGGARVMLQEELEAKGISSNPGDFKFEEHSLDQPSVHLLVEPK